MKIEKRDGRFVDFQQEKIINAIKKAFNEKNKDAKNIPYTIAEKIKNNYTKIKNVEDIQNEIEEELMKLDPEIAKTYILYREERRKARLKKDVLIEQIRNKTQAKNIKNSNANVDEKSFSGRKKEATDEIQKELALNYTIPKDIAEAHRNGLIYQHDISEYEIGSHNCLNIDFKQLFENGFSTRNGDVRTPSCFATACQLVAVAF